MTVTFWNVQSPAKPKGVKDPNAILDYPIDFSEWLADASDAYSTHEVITSNGELLANGGTGSLECDSSSEAAGVIIPVLSGGTVGETEFFTVRVTTASGRVDDRTFWLKITER